MTKTEAAQKTLVVVPTYNEKDNVSWLIRSLINTGLRFDLLFVDDNSPDGTGDVLDAIALTTPTLKVLHREGKSGIGSAHQAGIAYAYRNCYDVLITMDSDLTHSPDDIHEFIKYLPDYDVIVGSRYLKKDSLKGWNLLRRQLTHLANFLTTKLLGLPQDATGAFRVYRLDRVPPELFASVTSLSYSFFFESLHLLNQSGFKIKEVPISLPPRTYGSSKMSLKDALGSFKVLLLLAIKGLAARKRFKPRYSEIQAKGET